MAPIPIQANSFDIVIENFKSFHTVGYSERCLAGLKKASLNFAGRSYSVFTNVYLCQNGALEVAIRPNKNDPQQFCFRGRVHFVEGNISLALETVKFCHGRAGLQCKCGPKCTIGGAKEETRLRFPRSDNIPKKATLRFEFEFLPFDHLLREELESTIRIKNVSQPNPGSHPDETPCKFITYKLFSNKR